MSKGGGMPGKRLVIGPGTKVGDVIPAKDGYTVITEDGRREFRFDFTAVESYEVNHRYPSIQNHYSITAGAADEILQAYRAHEEHVRKYVEPELAKPKVPEQPRNPRDWVEVAFWVSLATIIGCLAWMRWFP